MQDIPVVWGRGDWAPLLETGVISGPLETQLLLPVPNLIVLG